MHHLLARTISGATLLVSLSASAEGPLVAREPFAKAHVQLMVRAEEAGVARMVDLEVWAEGTRLRALASGGKGTATELWIDGLSSEPILLRNGKVTEPARHSLEHGLLLALRPSPELGNSKNDRVAGKPCKVVTEEVRAGVTLTRCIWRGLPLSVELTGGGFAFNAAATLVTEGAVTVADVQPPLGAPSAAKGLSAGR